MEHTNLNHNNTSHIFSLHSDEVKKMQDSIEQKMLRMATFLCWYQTRILFDLDMRSWIIAQRLDKLTSPQYST